LGSRTRRARLMTTRRGQAPPSPLQISAPFCPLLCGAIDRSQPLPGRTRSSPPQHCNGATPRSRSLKQQHNFRHRFANPIRAGWPTPASLPVHHIEIARALVAKGRFGPVGPLRLRLSLQTLQPFRRRDCISAHQGKRTRRAENNSPAEWEGFSHNLPKGAGFCGFPDPLSRSCVSQPCIPSNQENATAPQTYGPPSGRCGDSVFVAGQGATPPSPVATSQHLCWFSSAATRGLMVPDGWRPSVKGRLSEGNQKIYAHFEVYRL
jgi:hypothetical protein